MFLDRKDAGIKLSEKLSAYKNNTNVIVLALPRGGVVLGSEVAKKLGVPLDIVVPRKIGSPDNPEYAIGAITESGVSIFNEAEKAKTDPKWLKAKVEKEKLEALRRQKTYRDKKSFPNLLNKIVIIVDDGIATGLTMRAAVTAIRNQNPAKIVVAVPVSTKDSAMDLRNTVDEFITLEIPSFFGAVSQFYKNFPEVTDKEVIKLLKTN